ncbi:MAG: GAF domain-containing protein, partial [Chloroflexota bacterium]|nr:GAF domain-containing protein [Chloroflexota bacterium]
ANRSIIDMAGYKNKEEVIGRSVFDFTSQGDRDRAMQNLEKIFIEGKKAYGDLEEYTLVDKTGREHCVEVSSSIIHDNEQEPRYIITVVRNVTRRKFEELGRIRFIKRQESLLAINQTLSETLDLQELLDKASTKIVGIMDVDASAIYLLDEGRQQLNLGAQSGFSTGFVSEIGTVNIDEDEISRLSQHRSAGIRLAESLSEENYSRIVDAINRDKFQTLTIEPLRAKGKLHGTVCIASRAAHGTTATDMELLRAVSNQIAVAIENAALYKDSEEKAKRLQLISAISMIIGSSIDINSIYETFSQGVKKLVDFDQSNITLIEGNNTKVIAATYSVETELVVGSTMSLPSTSVQWAVLNKMTNIADDLAKEKQFGVDNIHFKEGMRSAIRLPLYSKGDVIGTYNLLSHRPSAFGKREQQILQELTTQIAVAIENSRLFTRLKQHEKELEAANRALAAKTLDMEINKSLLDSAYFNMAKTVVLLAESRDQHSEHHSERVAELCRCLASKMGLPEDEITQIETAAMMLGLGKAEIPESILQKPGPLTSKERAELRSYQMKAIDMLRVPESMDGVVPILEGMHESFNGEGYPGKLRGNEIPVGARILAVTDAYIAMISNRPYRDAMTEERAQDTIRQGSGKQWDPQVITALLHVLK